MTRSPTQYRFRHYRAGHLLWASDGPDNAGAEFAPDLFHKNGEGDLWVRENQLWTPNTLADEGEKDILDVYFDDVAVRGTLYLRLYNDTPVETDTLATLTGEVSGTGYTGNAVTRGTDWTDPSLDSGDMRTVMSTKTFTAGGAWTAATYCVLATVQTGTSGLLIAYMALSTTRTLANTDTLDIDLAVKLQ